MPFLLSTEHKSDGMTHYQYDLSPSQRIQMVSFTAAYETVLGVPADTLFAGTLAEIRPPQNRRGTK